ncbi:hypothetical protein ADIMK_2199 [Marinobacterium lacunae]|uniref:N-acetyltransferase domain-containing protein n=1 Tax=Marinobacterium lacunae TaxID=1232683 RepID=A0A081FYM8_9GAMM|nr:GNAT family N-acetyltransferase [Marinobacterium lacunae]KEA63633.1 hypothetical protein ADIMK_2199 [Marinobacterium lacunae]
MTSDSLVLREAMTNDLEALLRLYAQPDMDNGNTLSLEEAEQLFMRMACYPDYRIYLALSGERIVGTFALLIMDNLAHRGNRSGIIEDVAVEPDFQGQGVGHFMMEQALDLARAKGCYKVTLSSNLKRERAHAFYESLGFERHGYSFSTALPIDGS